MAADQNDYKNQHTYHTKASYKHPSGVFSRPLVKSAYKKKKFLISQPKPVLWVLKRIVTMRPFFWASKTYDQTDELENI